MNSPETNLIFVNFPMDTITWIQNEIMKLNQKQGTTKNT